MRGHAVLVCERSSGLDLGLYDKEWHMLIGAHVGVAGGYPEALGYASSVGCEAVQVFAKSPRQWQAAALNEAAAALFRSERAAHRIGYVATHTAYLINLGSDDDALWERSWRALADELRRAESLGADACVTHMGTNRFGDTGRCAARVADAVSRALETTEGTARLLLENTAGAGTTYGGTPEEIGAVIALLPAGEAARVGVCLDTCHAHAYGYDLSTRQGWADVLAGFRTTCGAACVEVIHANDCAFGPGLHKDRHAWIGDGTIGLDGFAHAFSADTVQVRAMILEMPGEVPFKDAENIRRLRALREASVARGSGA